MVYSGLENQNTTALLTAKMNARDVNMDSYYNLVENVMPYLELPKQPKSYEETSEADRMQFLKEAKEMAKSYKHLFTEPAAV